jgi:hypothetical protein
MGDVTRRQVYGEGATGDITLAMRQAMDPDEQGAYSLLLYPPGTLPDLSEPLQHDARALHGVHCNGLHAPAAGKDPGRPRHRISC